MAQAAKRAGLYEEVMVQLAKLIRQGRLRPGDRLPPERELAERLHISRATLREALRAMQLQGLVESRHGAGNFIAGGRAEDLAFALNHLALRDIFELRMLTEPSIAALAAERADADDVARLEQALSEQEQQSLHTSGSARADIAFHSALAEATHNHALMELGARMMEVLSPSRDPSLQTAQRARVSLLSHRHIVECIKARDPDRARRAMEEHIRQVDMVVFGLPADSIPMPAGAIHRQAAWH